MLEHELESLYRLSSYEYFLPQHLIAQNPAEHRDQSRLLVLDSLTGSISHNRFPALVDLLAPGDLLVLNNTKVFPARLRGHKESGGKVELLFLHFPVSCGPQESTARALLKCAKRPKAGSLLHLADGTLQAQVEELFTDGKVELRLRYPAQQSLEQLFEQYGEMPLPPYIRRSAGSSPQDALRYQTTYARHVGSVAAPTAGLHFTPELMQRLSAKGVQQATVTLHVGYGTFAPVRCADIRQHAIHEEYIQLSPESAQSINAVKKAGGRIWAVGTTTARSLEFAAGKDGLVRPLEGACGLYIYPGYTFKVVDNLITNFHLPQSSLLFLVSALAGKEEIMTAYSAAVTECYRFFSYGDAMAIITKKP